MNDHPDPTSLAVVLVEDEPLVRELAACELADGGYTVIDFATADEALRYLSANASGVAALFTDVQMPGRLNGLDLADIVSRSWPHMALLVTSGGMLLDARQLPGAARFFAKPWRAEEVLTSLGVLTRDARSSDQRRRATA